MVWSQDNPHEQIGMRVDADWRIWLKRCCTRHLSVPSGRDAAPGHATWGWTSVTRMLYGAISVVQRAVRQWVCRVGLVWHESQSRSVQCGVAAGKGAAAAVAVEDRFTSCDCSCWKVLVLWDGKGALCVAMGTWQTTRRWGTVLH